MDTRIPALVCAAALLFGCATTGKAPLPESYYVSAAGSDKNTGLSAEAAFKSLFKALNMASRTGVRTITVLGRLDIASEQSSNSERVFVIQGTGKEQLTIRGVSGAVLSGEGASRRVVLVKGLSKVCFEDIEISDGRTQGEGGGLGIGEGAEVILGRGAVVTRNQASIGGGIALAPGGKLSIRGGTVEGNAASGIGGGVAVVKASLVMEGGEIRGNTAEGGGGAAVYEEGSFILLSGTVSGNQASIGGGVVLNRSGLLTMEGGLISENTASGSGGGLALIEKSLFALNGGQIEKNNGGQYGGGLASDTGSSLSFSGGVIRANNAGVRGGGVFTSGDFVKEAASDCVIYGNNAPAGDANSAPSGSAVYLLRNGGDSVRETSAGAGILLDSGKAGAGGGWEYPAKSGGSAPLELSDDYLPSWSPQGFNDSGAGEDR